MTIGAPLRERLVAMRRELIGRLGEDFDAGCLLPLLANVHLAIAAIDADASEAAAVAPATFGPVGA